MSFKTLKQEYHDKYNKSDSYRKNNSYSASNFINKFKHGIARQNRFRVEFVLPSGIMANDTVLGVNPTSMVGEITQQHLHLNRDETINIMCHTTQFPARDLALIPAGGGYPAAVPFGQDYQPVTFAFYTDPYYSTREYFDIWQNAVFNVKSRTINYYNEYTSDIRIHALDREGNTTYSVTLKEAYPNSISASDLSATDTDAVQTVTVSMSYRYWTSDTVRSFN